ncbi:MAG: tyrosine-type recombinase/integrase [Anaerolineae bacterium]
MSAQQLPLFPQRGAKGEYTPPLSPAGALNADSSLSAAIGGFHDYMIRKAFTENTIKSFLGDLRLLSKFLGPSRPIGKIGTKELNDFLTYLLYYRGKPCNPKSYSRRVTTLKVFFKWLVEEEIIPKDPAEPLIHFHVTTPLPQILHDEQVNRLLETTHRLLNAEKPDSRPHLLVTLILATGIKKSECMGIALNDIDLSNREAPVLYVRYSNPKMQQKERKLQLPPDFVSILERYLAEYKPGEKLFECTARNLEYVLRDVSELAGLPHSVSFEMLRMTCAVRDYRAGMPLERLRQKLGLSPITWTEVSEKIKRLAAPPL